MTNSRPGQKPIHLNRGQLSNLVHLGATTDLDDLERDDPAALRTVEQLGLFFAANPELADYAIDIDEILLTPRPGDAPPLAIVHITYKGQPYHLVTGEDGRLADLPFGFKKRKKKRWKKRKLKLTNDKG
jgi:hypothetical protein